ncbi:NAD(P)H-dependent flavin oxidoreductase, partial [Fulvivirga lutimaris]|uniref:NAD(P)H-dependent flavin oxidoreductase n=1 Tax=Fulvivirga lutimaris TaxID=1819566 RepID=UPI0012BC00C2
VWCSSWRLASAVSNAGGLGLIGAGSMHPELLQEHIRKCKAATSEPFGVNVPLLYPEIDKLMDIIVKEGAKIVFTSAGNPKTWTTFLKDKGIIVVHVVSSVKFALKSQEAGVDAVACEGFEAGGHNGREEITTFCLIPAVARALNIPVIAAGGIADGHGIFGALALGAEGVQVGTRFAISDESSAHLNFKKRIVECAEGETTLTLKQLAPVRLIKNEFYNSISAAEKQGADADTLRSILGKRRSKLGIFEGDLKEGELEIGQVSAYINDIRPAAEILKYMWAEYEQLKKDFYERDN